MNKRPPKRLRNGLTLLEVILAMTVLGLSMAAIGELVRLASRNAVSARDLTTAHFLAQSKMGEIKSGLYPAESVGPVPFDEYETSELNWFYTIQSEPIDDQGLLAVQVIVEQQNEFGYPVRYSLVTWMIDPVQELAPEEEEIPPEEAAASGAATSGAGGGQ